MFESVLVDQNPHWDGAVYPEGVPRLVMDDVKNHFFLTSFLLSASAAPERAPSCGR